eukprot:GILJ01013764.1.p1 GENE.GILJ01013764.1~~GILJ01013764.1.p1  ORF type:complete len:634 (+),score=71.72 GILJ01013764.1:288-1904(+)
MSVPNLSQLPSQGSGSQPAVTTAAVPSDRVASILEKYDLMPSLEEMDQDLQDFTQWLVETPGTLYLWKQFADPATSLTPVALTLYQRWHAQDLESESIVLRPEDDKEEARNMLSWRTQQSRMFSIKPEALGLAARPLLPSTPTPAATTPGTATATGVGTGVGTGMALQEPRTSKAPTTPNRHTPLGSRTERKVTAEPAPVKPRDKSSEPVKRQKWSSEEHKKFVEGLKRYGRHWRKIQSNVLTKTVTQVRNHAYKYFRRQRRLQLAQKQLENKETGAANIKPLKRSTMSALSPISENAEDSLSESSESEEGGASPRQLAASNILMGLFAKVKSDSDKPDSTQDSVQGQGSTPNKEGQSLLTKRNRSSLTLSTDANPEPLSPRHRSRKRDEAFEFFELTPKKKFKSGTPVKQRHCANIMCRRESPGEGATCAWHRRRFGDTNVYLCNACKLLFDSDKYCPYCFQIYREKDADQFDGAHWVGCDSCDRWVHVACEVQSSGFRPSRSHRYFCPACRSSPSTPNKPRHTHSSALNAESVLAG